MKSLLFAIGTLSVIKAGPFLVGGSISGSDISCLIAAAFFLWYLFSNLLRKRNTFLLKIHPIIILPFLLLLACAIGHAALNNFHGPNYTTFITSALVFISIYSLVQICYFANGSSETDYISPFFYGALFGIIFPYFLNKLGAVSNTQIYFYPGGRYKAFMPHQNHVGILATFCFTYFLLAERPRRKLLIMLACSLPLLLCTSKFNLAFCAFIFMCYSIFKIKLLPIYPSILIISAILFFAYQYDTEVINFGVYILNLANPDGASRLLAFATAPEDSETLGIRLFIWKQAWIVGGKSLPFGVGPAAAPAYLNGLVHAHNAVLNNFLVYGYFGLTYFCSIVFMISRLILASRFDIRSNAASVAALAGVVSSNMSDSFSNSTAVPILMGLSLAAASLARQRTKMIGHDKNRLRMSTRYEAKRSRQSFASLRAARRFVRGPSNG